MTTLPTPRPDDPALWLRRLTVAMWAVAGWAMAAEVSLRAPQRLQLSCSLGWMVAFALCGTSFWWTSREAGGPVRGGRWAALLALQAASVIFMIAWWESVLGGALLVFAAWQAGIVWPLRRALLWAAAQTLALALVMVPHSPHLLWLVTALVTGGLQLFAALAAQMLRAEADANLALARSNEELQTVQRLLARTSGSAERLQLARELHDGLGHRLTALSLMLETARHQRPDDAVTAAGRAHRLVGDVLAELRGVVGRMRDEPPLDLERALLELTADIRSPGVHLRVDASPGDIDAARAHALVRCAQEMITNAIKHSGARNLWLELDSTGGSTMLRARDDGRGAPGLREGFGIRGMRERMAQLGGRLELVAQAPDGGGFEARAILPQRTVPP